MKQFIVLISMLVLGVLIVHLIIGPGDSSIYSSVKDVWESEMTLRTAVP